MAMAKLHLATIPLVFGLLFSNLICALGKLECEDLPIEDCAFSVASTGTRCVLEKYQGKDKSIQYECQSSIIVAEKQEEWIESDECVNACGLERMTVGLSTDLLMDYHFTEKFCSSECLNNCPNIMDLYISLAAGEGMYLPQLCKAHRTRRVIADPVKKAMDAEYLRSLLPQLTSGGAMAPNGSPTPENGIPPGLLPKGPDYRGYGGYQGSPGDTAHASGGEFAPTSPVSGSVIPLPVVTTVPTPIAASSPPYAGPSTTKRPFFIGSPTVTPSTQPTPGAAGVSEPVLPPVSAISPSSLNLIGESNYAPTPSTSASSASTPSASSTQSMTSLPELNDEEYLYEAYFH